MGQGVERGVGIEKLLTSAIVQRAVIGHLSSGHVEMKPPLELKRRNKNTANGLGSLAYAFKSERVREGDTDTGILN